MTKVLRIGTRGSRLALAQAKEIKKLLHAKFPQLRSRIAIIKTTGDEFQGVELFKKNNIGVFTKAIEEKLLDGEIDVAVHSLKDLPTKLPKTLRIAAFPKRLDPSDVLISRRRFSLSELPRGASVGTGSPRRKRQVYILRPDLNLCDMRGNLDTRVRRVIHEKKYGAIIIALAGLVRLKKYLKYARVIPPDKLLPAVGQAALALEVRANDAETFTIIRKLNHQPTEKKVTMERIFLETLQGGCRVPVGVHSGISRGKIYLKAAVFSTTSKEFVTGEISRPVSQYGQAGKVLARRLLRMGAGKFLKEARHA